ncbi:serine/threonine-protein phosphatase [Streptomyces sp. Je 1-79]|uniref:PP2C family protein-serine/threonine phosphatase n=1 Tax=Streptomyces sp. Je 1-79 TaxID=2943847 RepID=UPI0021A67D47|nr:PP2C family protein-serine/threonine phosphatase [Streptomyces sp. Je 1-79]MCT4351519.1 serine/threonine-protein phosphatase [Streptomyces sp. Je 1-79]
MTVERALRGAPAHRLLDSLRINLAQQFAAFSVDLLLVDYGLTALRPVEPVQARAGLQPSALDSGPAGHAFTTQQPYLSGADGPTATAYLPVSVRGDRCGVLVVDLLPEHLTPRCAEDLVGIAETLGHALQVADRHTDVYRQTRRARALSIPAEMQWDMLPGRACAGEEFTLHAYWEPAYTSGGHVLDWSVTDEDLTLVVADGTGPGTPSVLVSNLALSALRNARRAGLDLVGQASLTDQALYGQHRGERSLSALLMSVRLADGEVRVVDAGSPTVWRTRGAVTERLDLERQLPLGMFEDTVYATQRLRILPGDRLVFLACDRSESPPGAGDPAADRAVSSAIDAARHLTCADTPRAVVRALRGTPGGSAEAVLVLCLDWHGGRVAERDADGGGDR